MIRAVIRLAVVGLIANFVWRVGFEYLAHYRFQDDVRNAIEHGNFPDPVLQQRIRTMAASFDIPMEETEPAVQHDGDDVVVEGRYQKPILLAPAFTYPWTFTWSVRGAPANRPRLDELTPLAPMRRTP